MRIVDVALNDQAVKELANLGIGFVSLTEAIDLITPSGRALAGMLAVFAEFERDILRERVKAGIAQAREWQAARQAADCSKTSRRSEAAL